MFACIIIEDQPPAQRILKNYISKTDNLVLRGTFSNPLEARLYVKNENIDLIFLDIHLPKLSGIDFLKSIPNHPRVILTTAYGEYALESYDYNVIDYLLKPFSYQRFFKSICKLEGMTESPNELENEKSSNILYIKSGYEVIKISSQSIIYINSYGDYTEIYTKNKKILASESLKHWLEVLDSNFSQVHKSYIVNERYFEKLSKNKIYLFNDYIVPLGRAYKQKFFEKNLN